MPSKLRVALVGNPNCGKTTIFNYLTGEKRAVGNYSGVTVEEVSGRRVEGDLVYEFVDLPGIYSLTTFSKDEVVARSYLLNEKPDVVVNVVDASNLERNLFLSLQLLELGLPIVVALNMCDLAASRGLVFDSAKLSKILGRSVVEIVGVSGQGCDVLLEEIKRSVTTRKDCGSDASILTFPSAVEKEIANIDAALDLIVSKKCEENSGDIESEGDLGIRWLLNGGGVDRTSVAKADDETATHIGRRDEPEVVARRRWLSIKLLEDDSDVVRSWDDPTLVALASSSAKKLASDDGAPIAAKFAALRYANVRKVAAQVVTNERRARLAWSDKVDRLLTHPLWGLLIFLASMYLVFWLTFTVGNYPVGWLENGQELLSAWCNSFWESNPDSLLRSLIVDGVIAGVGSVLVFFPNIFILFASISALEESGYLARGAFLTDRFLSRIGLTGKSFIPMLVGFGCSVPAVMSTRIIEDKKSRLATIFVIPLMSCGARYPIYMLLIPAFFPLKWQAPILWLIYVLGIVIAAVLSTAITSTRLKGERTPLLIELPIYHAPTFRTVGAKALERGFQYLHKAGTTILLVSILLWALSTFPRLPADRLAEFETADAALCAQAEQMGYSLDQLSGELAANVDASKGDEDVLFPEEMNQEQKTAVLDLLQKREQNEFEKAEAVLEYSATGRLGKMMEPVIKYAGFDWRIGSALVGAFAAKEVFVAQMGIVYKVGEVDQTSTPLRETLAAMYSPLAGVCVILFCLIGAPCMATLVVVAKESSWRWAAMQWLTLTILGFVVACATYQLGSLFRIGR